MKSLAVNSPHISLSFSYPADWYQAAKPVPKLLVPRQLFGVSNRPIVSPPAASSQPRPVIADLDPAAMFVWCYYQVPGDPVPADPDPLVDNGRFDLPLQYEQTIVAPAFAAREWDPSKFTRRRIGFRRGSIEVSVSIWEGTRASSADVDKAASVLESILPQ